jgi:hypothetical protein
MASASPIERESAERQFAGLLELRATVGRIAGGELDIADGGGAALASAYGGAEPIVQRRWDTLADEVSAWAAAGVEALAIAGQSHQPHAAAARLADELDQAIDGLNRLLRL